MEETAAPGAMAIGSEMAAPGVPARPAEGLADLGEKADATEASVDAVAMESLVEAEVATDIVAAETVAMSSLRAARQLLPQQAPITTVGMGAIAGSGEMAATVAMVEERALGEMAEMP